MKKETCSQIATDLAPLVVVVADRLLVDKVLQGLMVRTLQRLYNGKVVRGNEAPVFRSMIEQTARDG